MTAAGYFRGAGIVWEINLLDLNVRDEKLAGVFIVVGYHKAEKEWDRARIVERFRRA